MANMDKFENRVEIPHEELMELLKEKKVHMFIMLFDSKTISKEGIVARAAEAFPRYLFHTWFMGDT